MFVELDNITDVADSKRDVISAEDNITDAIGLGDDITVYVLKTEEEE